MAGKPAAPDAEEATGWQAMRATCTLDAVAGLYRSLAKPTAAGKIPRHFLMAAAGRGWVFCSAEELSDARHGNHDVLAVRGSAVNGTAARVN